MENTAKRITITERELKYDTEQDFEISCGIQYWIEEMQKIQEIEKHFGIRIKLRELKTPEETEDTFRAVDVVYSGIHMKPNIWSRVDCFQVDDDFVVHEPILIASSDTIRLPCLTIHDFVFSPQRLFLMPTRITGGEEKIKVFLYTAQYEVRPS